MINASIQDGDVLIVDNSIEPKNNQIVIASINGEITIKHLLLKKDKLLLRPENKDFTPIAISKEMDFKIIGTVTHVIHAF